MYQKPLAQGTREISEKKEVVCTKSRCIYVNNKSPLESIYEKRTTGNQRLPEAEFTVYRCQLKIILWMRRRS